MRNGINVSDGYFWELFVGMIIKYISNSSIYNTYKKIYTKKIKVSKNRVSSHFWNMDAIYSHDQFV